MPLNSDSDDWALVPRPGSSSDNQNIPSRNESTTSNSGNNNGPASYDEDSNDSGDSIDLGDDKSDEASNGSTPDDIELIDDDDDEIIAGRTINDSPSQTDRLSSIVEQDDEVSNSSALTRQQLLNNYNNSTVVDTTCKALRLNPEDDNKFSASRSLSIESVHSSVSDEPDIDRPDNDDLDSEHETDQDSLDDDLHSNDSYDDERRNEPAFSNVTSIFEHLDRLNTCIDLISKIRAYLQVRAPGVSVGTAVVFFTALGIGIGSIGHSPRDSSNAIDKGKELFELNLNQRQLFNLKRLQNDLIECAKRRGKPSESIISGKRICSGHERFWRSRFDALSSEHGVDVRKILLKAEGRFRASVDSHLKPNTGLSLSFLSAQLDYLDKFERERVERSMRQTLDSLREENRELHTRLRQPRDSDHQQLIIEREIRVSRLERENSALKDKLSKKTGSVYIKQQSHIERLEEENDALRTFINYISARLASTSLVPSSQSIKLSERQDSDSLNVLRRQLSAVEINVNHLIANYKRLSSHSNFDDVQFDKDQAQQQHQQPQQPQQQQSYIVDNDIGQTDEPLKEVDTNNESLLNATQECDRKLQNCLATSSWMHSNVDYWKRQYDEVNEKLTATISIKNSDNIEENSNANDRHDIESTKQDATTINANDDRDKVVKEGDLVELIAFVVASAAEKSTTFAQIVNELRASLHEIHHDEGTSFRRQPQQRSPANRDKPSHIIYGPHDEIESFKQRPNPNGDKYFDSLPSPIDMIHPLDEDSSTSTSSSSSSSSLLTGLVKLLTAHINVDNIGVSDDDPINIDDNDHNEVGNQSHIDPVANWINAQRDMSEKRRCYKISEQPNSSVDDNFEDIERRFFADMKPVDCSLVEKIAKSTEMQSGDSYCRARSSCVSRESKKFIQPFGATELAASSANLETDTSGELDSRHHVQSNHYNAHRTHDSDTLGVSADRWIGANSLQVQRALIETAARMIAGPDLMLDDDDSETMSTKEESNEIEEPNEKAQQQQGQQQSWLFERSKQRRRLRKMRNTMEAALADWLFKRARSREQYRRKNGPSKPVDSYARANSNSKYSHKYTVKKKKSASYEQQPSNNNNNKHHSSGHVKEMRRRAEGPSY